MKESNVTPISVTVVGKGVSKNTGTIEPLVETVMHQILLNKNTFESHSGFMKESNITPISATVVGKGLSKNTGTIELLVETVMHQTLLNKNTFKSHSGFMKEANVALISASVLGKGLSIRILVHLNKEKEKNAHTHRFTQSNLRCVQIFKRKDDSDRPSCNVSTQNCPQVAD